MIGLLRGLSSSGDDGGVPSYSGLWIVSWAELDFDSFRFRELFCPDDLSASCGTGGALRFFWYGNVLDLYFSSELDTDLDVFAFDFNTLSGGVGSSNGLALSLTLSSENGLVLSSSVSSNGLSVDGFGVIFLKTGSEINH